MLEPCLNQPCGLLASSRGLKIADLGNHSVRSWSLLRDTLNTMVGAASQDETRWGLVRDGLPEPLDERFAALESPRTLSCLPDQSGTVVVSSGTCLGLIQSALGHRDLMRPVLLECTPGTLAQPCVARFSVETVSPAGIEQGPRTIHYTVDFLEADGTLAERVRGTGSSWAFISVQCLLGQRGQAKVVLRCVSDQGVASGAEAPLEVR